jgi:hypothetical protein
VSQLKQYSILESLSTAFLKKVKSLRLSLGRPSRSDLVLPEYKMGEHLLMLA